MRRCCFNGTLGGVPISGCWSCSNFFFGDFWKRLNAKGCLYDMVAGFMLGLFRILVDTPETMKLKGFEHDYTQGTFLWIVNNINFQYFSIITLFSALMMLEVSYATPGATILTNQEPHLRHGHQRRPDQDERQLWLVGSAGLRLLHALHPRHLPLFPRIVVLVLELNQLRGTFCKLNGRLSAQQCLRIGRIFTQTGHWIRGNRTIGWYHANITLIIGAAIPPKIPIGTMRARSVWHLS